MLRIAALIVGWLVVLPSGIQVEGRPPLLKGDQLKVMIIDSEHNMVWGPMDPKAAWREPGFRVVVEGTNVYNRLLKEKQLAR